jgi:hypothetical protein
MQLCRLGSLRTILLIANGIGPDTDGYPMHPAMKLQRNTQTGAAHSAASSEAQIHITASAERVWDLLSNIDRWPMWNSLVQSATLTGPLQAGSVFKWKSKGLSVTSTLQEVRPRQSLTWTGKAFGTRAIHSWEIEVTDQGAVLRTAESFDGWLPRLMPKTMKRTLDETLPAWLKAIKSEAERAAAMAPTTQLPRTRP